MPFTYPTKPYKRRHGPAGYKSYRQYKNWLRDEFVFRCAYCLFRERWFPDGDTSFGVDHVIPQCISKSKICDYDNLVYACLRCNSQKSDSSLLDPCEEAYGVHLQVDQQGMINSLTAQGAILIDFLLLNKPDKVEYRRRILQLLSMMSKTTHQELKAEIKMNIMGFMGFPDDLPDLRRLRPPSNSRPKGVRDCYFAQREKGELPEMY